MTEKPNLNFRELGAAIGDDLDWPARSEYWRNYQPARTRGRPRKFNYRGPLILCGHGVRLRVNHGTLLVQNGFTHYPQKTEEIRYFPGDPNLPDRIIILDASGGITFDALEWMFEQKIALVQLDWRGDAGMVGNANYSANSKLARAQTTARMGRSCSTLARWLVAEKSVASVITLEQVIPKSSERDRALAYIKSWLAKFRASKPAIATARISGIEGAIARAYFGAWQGMPLNWRVSKQKPVPPSWLEIGPRKMSWRRSGQNARHPINAMLNYGYGILAAKIRTQIAAAGLDPSIGIMHGTSQNRIPLVYDLMEPLRPVVDRHILSFAFSQTFVPGDFTINQWGGCRLNPQMARSMVKHMPSLNEAENLVGQFLVRLQTAR